MAENKQDKRDIVNPNPERYTSAVPQARRGPRPYRKKTLFGYEAGTIRDAVLEWRGVPQNWGKTTEGERRGLDYDYSSKRNKWFIGWLHETFKKGKDFPPMGNRVIERLWNENNGLNADNSFITINDLLAYAALYPQNAKVVMTASGTPNGKDNPRIGGYIIALVPLSSIEKAQTLKKVVKDVKRESPENKTALETVTTDDAQKPSNQTPEANDRGSLSTPLPVGKYVVKKGDWLSRIATRHDTTVAKILEIPQNSYIIGAPTDDQGRKRSENGHWIYPGDIVTLPSSVAVSRMPSVTPTVSKVRKKEYDIASEIPPGPNSGGGATLLEAPTPSVRSADRGVDLNSPWGNCPQIKPPATALEALMTTNNMVWQLPSQLKKIPRKVYYNSSDKSWYCVATTMARNPQAFDIANQEDDDAGVITGGNAYEWMKISTEEILKAADKYSEDNYNQIIREHNTDDSSVEIFFASHYGHPGRPQPIPAGTDVWLISTRIDDWILRRFDDDGSIGKEEDEPDPLVVSKAIMNLEVPARRAPFTISKLKTNLRNISKMLEATYAELANDGITPSMMEGVNLLEEAEHINTFYNKIETWTQNRNITISDSDRIEFLLTEEFTLQLIYYNGAVHKVSHEMYDDGSIDILPDPEFEGVWSVTFALVFFGEKITQIRRMRKSERPPATEFVTRFIYPSPIIRPTEIAAKKEKNLEENKYPSEPTGAALGSNSFGRSAPPESENPSFKTESEVQKEFDKRLARGKQFMGGYIGVLNNAGCESPLAKYLNDAFLLFQLMGGKCSFKELVATVLRLIKEDIMISKQQEQLLLLGAGYTDNPDLLWKQIESQINQEIMCLFGLLGDILENEVLDPGGVPPEVTKLVKAGLTPPRGINFTSISIPDLAKIWREMIKMLVLEFIKQLILSAFKELLLASAGCGGQTVVDSSKGPKKRSGASAANFAPSRYNAININELVDYKGIDLEEMAAELNLYNTLYREDNLKISPATEEQLRQLNDDASEVLVDIDLTALLQGTAPSETINLLYRTFNMGPIDLNSIDTSLRRQIENNQIKAKFAKAIVGEFQESARAGDTRYGSLNLDRRNIRKYFKRLGQLLGAEVVLGLEEQLDPKLDLCERGDILGYGLGAAVDIDSLSEGEDDDAVVAGGLSKKQILKQIRGQIDSDTRRITSLCDLNASDFDFIADVQNFWDLIPFPAFFLKLLGMIRGLMQNVLRMQAEGAVKYGIRIKSQAEDDEAELDANNQINPVRPEDTEVGRYFYRFWGGGSNDDPGLQLASTVRMVERSDRENQVRSPRWVVGTQDAKYNVARGEVELVYIPGDPSLSGSPRGTCKVVFNRTVGVRGPMTEGQERLLRQGGMSQRRINQLKFPPLYEPERVLAEFHLAEDNLPESQLANYSIKNHLSRVDPSHFDTAQRTRLNRYIKALLYMGYAPERGEQEMPIGGRGGALGGARQIAQRYNLGEGRNPSDKAWVDVHALAYPTVNNYYNIPDTVVKVTYGSQRRDLQRRLTDTLIRASVPVFGPNSDPCNLPTEEFKARTVLNMFQVRLISFIMNGLPWFNNGYSLMTPDTINMLGSYLSNKILNDLYEKDSQGSISMQKIWEGVEIISKTCTLYGNETDDAGNPLPLKEDTEDDKVEFRFDNLSEQDTGTDLPGMFHYIIRQMLKRMLLNVSAGSAITETLDGDDLEFQGYVTTKRNYFKIVEDNAGEELGGPLSGFGDRYKLLARYLKKGYTRENQGDHISLGGWLTLGGGNREQLGFNRLEDVRNMSDEDFINERYLAYMPIPLLVGLQYIYIDKVVNITQNTPNLAFQERTKVRMADIQAMQSLDPEYFPPALSSEYTDYDLKKELKRSDSVLAGSRNIEADQNDAIMKPWKESERRQNQEQQRQQAEREQQDIRDRQRVARQEGEQQEQQEQEQQEQQNQPEQREQQEQQQEQQQQQREDEQQQEQQGGRQQPHRLHHRHGCRRHKKIPHRLHRLPDVCRPPLTSSQKLVKCRRLDHHLILLLLAEEHIEA